MRGISHIVSAVSDMMCDQCNSQLTYRALMQIQSFR